MEHQHPYGQDLKSNDLASLQDSQQQFLALLSSEMKALEIMKSIRLELPIDQIDFLAQLICNRERLLLELLEHQADFCPD